MTALSASIWPLLEACPSLRDSIDVKFFEICCWFDGFEHFENMTLSSFNSLTPYFTFGYSSEWWLLTLNSFLVSKFKQYWVLEVWSGSCFLLCYQLVQASHLFFSAVNWPVSWGTCLCPACTLGLLFCCVQNQATEIGSGLWSFCFSRLFSLFVPT